MLSVCSHPFQVFSKLVVIGVLCTVANSWGSLLIARIANAVPPSILVTPPSWPPWAPPNWPEAGQQNRTSTWWCEMNMVHSNNATILGRTYDARIGWPLHAMSWRCIDRFNGDGPAVREIQYGVRLSETGPLMLSILPVLPRWPAFVLNTVLYGVSAWIIMVLGGCARRVYRLRHNACPSCGYHLLGVGNERPCPECGFKGRSVQ